MRHELMTAMAELLMLVLMAALPTVLTVAVYLSATCL